MRNVFGYTLAVAVAVVITMAGSADAIPAFAKKYDAPCSLCHTGWPKLSETGVLFKLNGYQMPGTADGNVAAKRDTGDNVFLDVDGANPPISVYLEGGIVVTQPLEGPDGLQGKQFLCCAEGSEATIVMGGTATADVAYYVALPWQNRDLTQGYLRFVNFFAPGLAAIDLGVMNVIDYDVVSPSRNWFGEPQIAFHGSPSNKNGGPLGYNALYPDTGLRLYGRPNYGDFTYEVGVFSGAQVVGEATDDSEFAYTFLGRWDHGPVSISGRYWINKTGVAEVNGFAADPFTPDETTEQFIVGARFTHDYFEVEVAVDYTSFDIADRLALVDGVESTFSMDPATRTAYTLEGRWYPSQWLHVGAAFNSILMGAYDHSVSGAITANEQMSISLLALRVEFRPINNMRIGLEGQVDLSDELSRTNPGADAAYEPQHKLLLQWDFTF
jgi:hypothetical protein